MKLTVEKLRNYRSCWYAKDNNGFIAEMYLSDSYLPNYILDDAKLYYQLTEYMFELEKKYNSYLLGKHKKEIKDSGLSYKDWIKSVYKSFFKYYGSHNLYDCQPTYRDKTYIRDKSNNVDTPILISEIPKEFHDIIPKYKINFSDTKVIEDASKFSLPDSYAKKKYPWLNT